MIDKILPIIPVLIVLAIVAIFIVVLFIPEGQKWLTDMMLSSNDFHPDYTPTSTLSYSDQGFLSGVIDKATS